MPLAACAFTVDLPPDYRASLPSTLVGLLMLPQVGPDLFAGVARGLSGLVGRRCKRPSRGRPLQTLDGAA